jgi:pilus assembly protein CpaC
MLLALCLMLTAAPGVTEVKEPDVHVKVGAEQTLTVANLSRIALGDPAIADVKVQGQHQLVVSGKSQGGTTLLVWSGKKRHVFTVRVHR